MLIEIIDTQKLVVFAYFKTVCMKQANCISSRFIIPFTLVILISNQTYAQQKKQTDLEKEGLKGAVSEVEHKEWKAAEKFGTAGKTEYIIGVQEEYTPNGYIKATTYIDENNKLSSKTVYILDNSSNIKESKSYDSDGTLISYTTYKYHPGQFLKEKSYFMVNGKVSDISYYNEIGQILDRNRSTKNDEGAKIDIWKYSYDNEGNEKSRKYYKEEDGVQKEIYATLFKYHQKRLILEENYDYGRYTGSTEYKYDISGGTTRIEYYPDGSIRNKTTSKEKYNSQHDIEEFVYTTSSGEVKIQTYMYDYDAKGNWTRKIKYESKSEGFLGVPVRIEERKIKYYN